MNAPAFTPGPWHWHCSRTLMHLHDANGSCFAEVSMRRSLMHEADANLIAAAPDGYAFAESFLAWLEQLRKIRAPKDLLPGLEAREREARAFLAKAQGGAA